MKHKLEPTLYYNNFGPYEPVLHVAPGDTIVSKCLCAGGLNERGEKLAPRGNPLTGPIYIDGAEAGDALTVILHHLWPNRESGWTRRIVAPHVLDAPYVRELPIENDPVDWFLELEKGTATLREPLPALGELTLTLDPLLGCLGVAPKGHQALSAATSAEHGGNMDYRGVRSDVALSFPVFEEGALLFFGDGHAVQGDGEIIGTGIEVSFDVEFSVRLIKHAGFSWPRGENATHIFTIGNARPLDQAVQHATTEMMRWLKDSFALDAYAASALLGQCVEYDLGNFYDPAYTMVCQVSKQLLKDLPQQ